MGKNWRIWALAWSWVMPGLDWAIMGAQKSIISSMLISPANLPCL